MAWAHDPDIPRSQRPRICTVSDDDGGKCTRPVLSIGLCKAHYMRLYRKGDPGPVELRGSNGQIIDDATALAIKKRIDDGRWSIKDAAAHFHVSYHTIRDIVKGRRAITRDG